jgi:ADP-dependent NAD(P)H-hydrate dehydratase / NAD(P)H-hydrate epimerase
MSVPIISVSQMREWEKATWASGLEEAAVINRVGEIVACRAAQMVAAGESILVLAGHGHNGDDARRAKEYLASHFPDFSIQLCEVTDPAKEAAEVAHWLDKQPALIIDGLFGIGINRPLDEHWQPLIARINALQTQVLSVDVPSGLNADTGLPEGAAIHASVTLTLAAPKRGLLLPSAWPYVGRLEVAPEIGLVKCPFTGEMNWTQPGDFKNFPPARSAIANKGDFGHLAIVAGSLGYHGAAVLTARGAQRAQPGLITLHTPEVVYHVIASQLQAVMVKPWQPELQLPGNYHAILIGPGLAAEDLPDTIKLSAKQVWRNSSAPVVMDASALDWISTAVIPKNFIRVITPHPGEAGRMLRISAQQVQANRPKALRELSQRLGNCWVVLKGSQTLIGRSTGEIFVNPSGNAQLAQGGSGDLLSGFLAGLLAQKALQVDPLKTLRYGVWQHGIAADRLSRNKKNWVVEDLASEIGG